MRPKHKQSGGMLIVSIFVIVIMTLLGLAMTQLLSTASNSIVFEVGGLRALNAARSGLNRELIAQFPLGAAPRANCSSSPSPVAFNSSVNGLAGCQYKVSCSCTSHNFNGQINNFFRISSQGSCTMGDMQMSRTVAVESRVQLASGAGC